MTLPTDTEFTKICMLGSASPSTCYIHVASVLNVVHLLHLILVKIIFSSRGVRESAYFSSPFSFSVYNFFLFQGSQRKCFFFFSFFFFFFFLFFSSFFKTIYLGLMCGKAYRKQQPQ